MILAWLGVSLVYSFGFLVRLVNARQGLFVMLGNRYPAERVLREGARMAPFAEICENAMLGFGVGLALPLFFMVYRYLYHYQGSKSIYLMRRLSDRGVLRRNCILAPLAEMLGIGALGVVLYLLYVGIYLLATPAGCLVTGWRR